MRPTLTASADETVPPSAWTSNETRTTVVRHRGCQGLAQSREIRADLDRLARACGQQLLLDRRHRHGPALSVPKVQPRLLRLHRSSFEEKDACDDLQAVCNAMLHLLQQHFLLSQKLRHLPFGGAPLGYIFDRQEDELASTPLTDHLPRVQEHGASPDSGKFALIRVTHHDGALRRDIFQQEPKRGNIPLPVAQRVNRTIFNVLTSYPERLTKSAVCADDTKMLIQDEKGIPDRIHDPLGESVHIIDIDVDERLPIGRGQGVRGRSALSIDSTFPCLTLIKSNHSFP